MMRCMFRFLCIFMLLWCQIPATARLLELPDVPQNHTALHNPSHEVFVGRSGGSFGGSRSSSRSYSSGSSSSGFGSSSSRSYSRSYSSSSSSSRSYNTPTYIPRSGSRITVNTINTTRSPGSYSATDVILGLVFFVVVGVVGLIVLALVIGVIANALSKKPSGSGKTARALQVQLMLAGGEEVKAALGRIAETGNSDSNDGLTRMLAEAALTLLRYPDRWFYGGIVEASGTVSEMDQQVGRWATEARSQFTDETTRNHQGIRTSASLSDIDPGKLFVVVTLAAGSSNLVSVMQGRETIDPTMVREGLMALSNIQANDLVRIEVVWSPDQEGEFLSEDEAIRDYPKLTKL